MQIITGNIFDSPMTTLVNTVNCVGVMGAGIALEHRLRNPEMFSHYKRLCDKKLLTPGKLWLWKKSPKWVLNFPTKLDWKQPSKIQYIEMGLENFVGTYRDRGITSIAFPLLGTQNGGIDADQSLGLMTAYLAKCDIPVEIYKHGLNVTDSLLAALRRKVSGLSAEEFSERSKVKLHTVSLLVQHIYLDEFKMISQLEGIRGVSTATIEKLYAFAINFQSDEPRQNLLI